MSNDRLRVVSRVLGLGIDAGGTQTRWALAAAPREIVAEGAVRGMSALQVGEGNNVRDAMAELAAAALPHGRPARIHGGVTGFGESTEALRRLIAAPFGLDAALVSLVTDVEITYLDLFAPGEGYAVYAGTGSVAAFVDESGTLHRAGGRGVMLDDGGGGFWIAREALRHVWRREDERPGSWRDSPMATALLEAIGGTGWTSSREFIYGRDRGAVGSLAQVVARAAGEDPVAREILAAAGTELARLGVAMTGRFGPRPIALTGRAATLHPLIAEAMRAALPSGIPFALRSSHAQHAAARIALAKALP